MNHFPIPTVPSKFAPSFGTIANEWFVTVGGEYLRKVEGTEDWPTPEELGSYLLREAHRRESRKLTPGTGAGAARSFAYDALVKTADNAARYLLKGFRPRNRRRFTTDESRRGGQRSTKAAQKRRTMQAYLDLQEELARTGEVVSWTEQAERLGISTRYLRTLRTEHAAHLAQPTWDDLLAEADAQILETKRKQCVAPPRRHVLLRVLDSHPDILGETLRPDDLLSDIPTFAPVEWAVAA